MNENGVEDTAGKGAFPNEKGDDWANVDGLPGAEDGWAPPKGFGGGLLPNENGAAVVVGVLLAPKPPNEPVVLGRGSSPPVETERPNEKGAAVVVGVGAGVPKEKGFGSSGFDDVAKGLGAAADGAPKLKGDGGATDGEAGAGVGPPNSEVPLPKEKFKDGLDAVAG